MDNPRERLLAGVLGGAGTLGAILIYQAIPDLVRFEHLTIRLAHALGFAAIVFGVGFAGGFLGHLMFVRMTGWPMVARGVLVGAVVGLGIAGVGWSVTYTLRDLLFPFRPFDEMDDLMMAWLRNALVAGPVVGVVVALAVVRHLRSVERRQPVAAPPAP